MEIKDKILRLTGHLTCLMALLNVSAAVAAPEWTVAPYYRVADFKPGGILEAPHLNQDSGTEIHAYDLVRKWTTGDVLIYRFDLPAGAETVRIELEVSGDLTMETSSDGALWNPPSPGPETVAWSFGVDERRILPLDLDVTGWNECWLRITTPGAGQLHRVVCRTDIDATSRIEPGSTEELALLSSQSGVNLVGNDRVAADGGELVYRIQKSSATDTGLLRVRYENELNIVYRPDGGFLFNFTGVSQTVDGAGFIWEGNLGAALDSAQNYVDIIFRDASSGNGTGFTVDYLSLTQPAGYRDGDLMTIWFRPEVSPVQLTADFSGVDDKYDRADERITPVADGWYRIDYMINATNATPNDLAATVNVNDGAVALAQVETPLYNPPVDYIHFLMGALSHSEQLLLVSLAGLVNREGPRIYIDEGGVALPGFDGFKGDEWFEDTVNSAGVSSALVANSDPYALLEKYSEYFDGYVLIDDGFFGETHVSPGVRDAYASYENTTPHEQRHGWYLANSSIGGGIQNVGQVFRVASFNQYYILEFDLPDDVTQATAHFVLSQNGRILVAGPSGVDDANRAAFSGTQILEFTDANFDSYRVDISSALSANPENRVYLRFEPQNASQVDGPLLWRAQIDNGLSDPGQEWMVNIGATLAGVYGKLLLNPDMYTILLDQGLIDPSVTIYQGAAGVESLDPDAYDIIDLRGVWNTPLEAYDWLYRKVAPLANPDLIGQNGPNRLNDKRHWGQLDYYISKGAFVFYYNLAEADYKGVESFLETWLGDGSVLNPIYAFGWALPEHTGTKGLGNIPSLSANDIFMAGAESFPHSFSYFHNLNRVDLRDMTQTLNDGIEPDPTKIYVTFIYSDGDNNSVLYGRGREYWDDPNRGSIPMGWGFSPISARIAPAFLQFYYRTRSATDIIQPAVSGTGYGMLADMEPDYREQFIREAGELYARLGMAPYAWVLEHLYFNQTFPIGYVSQYAHQGDVDAVFINFNGDGENRYDPVEGVPAFTSVSTYIEGSAADMAAIIKARGDELIGQNALPGFIFATARGWITSPSFLIDVRNALPSNYEILRPDVFVKTFQTLNPNLHQSPVPENYFEFEVGGDDTNADIWPLNPNEGPHAWWVANSPVGGGVAGVDADVFRASNLWDENGTIITQEWTWEFDLPDDAQTAMARFHAKQDLLVRGAGPEGVDPANRQAFTGATILDAPGLWPSRAIAVELTPLLQGNAENRVYLRFEDGVPEVPFDGGLIFHARIDNGWPEFVPAPANATFSDEAFIYENAGSVASDGYRDVEAGAAVTYLLAVPINADKKAVLKLDIEGQYLVSMAHEPASTYTPLVNVQDYPDLSRRTIEVRLDTILETDGDGQIYLRLEDQAPGQAGGARLYQLSLIPDPPVSDNQASRWLLY